MFLKLLLDLGFGKISFVTSVYKMERIFSREYSCSISFMQLLTSLVFAFYVKIYFSRTLSTLLSRVACKFSALKKRSNC